MIVFMALQNRVNASAPSNISVFGCTPYGNASVPHGVNFCRMAERQIYLIVYGNGKKPRLSKFLELSEASYILILSIQFICQMAHEASARDDYLFRREVGKPGLLNSQSASSVIDLIAPCQFHTIQPRLGLF
jgi:hypothetical protein